MKLLLDTHIWVWMSLEPWRITSEVNQVLSDPENELWISAVSIWEIVLLLEKKRIKLDEGLHAWVANTKRELTLREAPLSWDVALDLPFTPLMHQDPADRLLVATARVLDLTLVTADTRLMRTENVRILANS
jgi:PIN domain nuclease of toxin-antitoxin system